MEFNIVNQGILLCLSFTMIVGIVLFLYIHQKTKHLGNSIDSLIELLHSYSNDLHEYTSNNTNTNTNVSYQTSEILSDNEETDVSAPLLSRTETSAPEIQLSPHSQSPSYSSSKRVVLKEDNIYRQDSNVDFVLSKERIIVSDDESEHNDDMDVDVDVDSNNDEYNLDSNTNENETENDNETEIGNHTQKELLSDDESYFNDEDEFEKKITLLSNTNNDIVNSNSNNESNPKTAYKENENQHDINFNDFSVVRLKQMLKDENIMDNRDINKMKKKQLVDTLTKLYNNKHPQSSDNVDNSVNEYNDDETKDKEEEHEKIVEIVDNVYEKLTTNQSNINTENTHQDELQHDDNENQNDENHNDLDVDTLQLETDITETYNEDID